MKIEHRSRHAGRRGSALIVALIAAFALAALAAAIVAVNGAHEKEQVAATERARALYAAEAGLSEAIANVRNGVIANWGGTGADDGVDFGGGACWGTAVDNGDDTFTVSSFARVGNQTRAVQAILVREDESPFTSAIFAGNSGGDPLYDLRFGGLGVQADEINGNVYSGGNIVIDGQASIDGSIRAVGTVSGGSGATIASPLPIPDIAGMDYANNHDVDVAQSFQNGASYKSNPLGGKAWQLPESDPAHIFRKNPSDRAADTATTVKDDYFLEDPYETPKPGSTVTAASGTHITVTGMPGKPGRNGNELVYYVDGNLWMHNRNLYTFTMFHTGTDPVRVTFVVRGNVYFSDNIFYHDQRDAVAFIAIEDPAVPDSGNIYFGDPQFGTLRYMDAFMYAENDFIDNNLSATGSSTVTVNGNMTAGNHVRIMRDFGNQHSKLTVNFDDRLAVGGVVLPGIPEMGEGDGTTWTVVGWREIAAH
jgi:hypothetical protein